MVQNCRASRRHINISGLMLGIVLTAVTYSSGAAQQQDGTVKFVNFSEATSKGNFIGCQILFKMLSPDHVNSAGNLIALTVNFSSYHLPGKEHNYMMKVCGWDVKGDNFAQFDVEYAFLVVEHVSWSKKENTTFINDRCFNAVYFGAAATDFGLASLSDPKRVAFARAGGTLDAVVR